MYEKVLKRSEDYGIIFEKSDKAVALSQVGLFSKMWCKYWAKNLFFADYGFFWFVWQGEGGVSPHLLYQYNQSNP